MSPVVAPWSGLIQLLSHPRWWFLPIAATACAILITLVLAGSTGWLLWPESTASFWSLAYWAQLSWVLGVTGLVMVLSWFALLPVLRGLAYEGLMRRVFREQQIEISEEGVLNSARSALTVFVKSIGWTIAWPLLTLLSAIVFSPVAPVVAHLGLAHGSCLAALDTGLALRGRTGSDRIADMKRYRGAVWTFSIGAALLAVPLMLTVVGWVLWLPAVFVGCALWIARMQLPSTA